MFRSIINRIQKTQTKTKKVTNSSSALIPPSEKADLMITAELVKTDLATVTNKLLKIQEEVEAKKQLESHLTTLLRFMPIEIVDILVALLSKRKSPTESIYQQAKERFFAAAPYFSRYTINKDLIDLGHIYSRGLYLNPGTMPKDIFRKYITENDMKYGENRKNKAMALFLSLTDDKTKTMTPISSEYNNLPPSSKKTRRAAALLEKISQFISSDTEAASNYFRVESLRDTESWRTPIHGRYAFALPILKKVYALSNANDFEKKDTSVHYKMLYMKNQNEKIFMNEIICPPNLNLTKNWHHGRAKISETWTYIEDKFEELWDMEIQQPLDKTDPEEQEAYKKQLTRFYAETAELLWLTGNTQPLKRGSGSYAELLFGILHLRHGLQTPILKLEFPQLDVLNISIPLSDYKKMFTYFFEPCTIPEHLHFNISSSLSIEDQLEAVYKKINLNPIFPKVIFHGKIEAFNFIAKQPNNKLQDTSTTDDDEEPKLPQRVRMKH